MADEIAQKCSKGNTRPLSKSRNWCFTQHTGEDSPPTYYANKTKYLLYGSEICPTTGKHHWQCFIVWNSQRTWDAMKKDYPGVHFEACKGSVKQNVTYCKKEGKWKEFGEQPEQGARNDIKAVAEEILQGETSCEDIICNNPMLYHQYGRTFDKLEDIRMRKLFRTEMTKGIWYYGDTGTGKSHAAFQNFSPETHYNVPKDGSWWDGYRQQDTVIINEFRGHIAYDELLALVDKWPVNVNRRGREPMPFISKTVIITSALAPWEVYHNRNDKDSIEQFFRRFEINHLTECATSSGNPRL